MTAPRWRLSPVSSRYLLREFFGLLAPILLTFMIIYLLVDFFDRLDILLRNHATLGSALRYFLFKVPLIVTLIIPPATLAAMLLSLGVLSRRNEIIAWRASGVSLLQTSQPLLGVAALISVGTLAWNETVVPYCAREYQYVNNVEIRKRAQRGILSDREIWYHGADGFYNIEHIDPRRRVLFGLTIYRTDAAFDLRSIIEVPAAQWKDNRWDSAGATERTIGPTGEIVTREIPANELIIHETLSDFLEVHRQPEELSYRALRTHLRNLSRKGIDTSNYRVDLHLKLAVPFTTLVLAWVAIPLAGRVQRHPSVAGIVGTGLVTGFSYWVVLALTNALGQSGALPALVSAWTANAIFGLLGCGLFLSSE
jgi:lipopolysaccharide export system permease protein